eukprot:2717874-Prymnesium_polylepis.1
MALFALHFESLELRARDVVDAVGWARVDGLVDGIAALALLEDTRLASLLLHSEARASDGRAVRAADALRL